MENIKVKGYVFTFVSYVIWGLLPMYWKQLKMIDAISLLTIRVVMTALTLLLVVAILKRPLFINYLKVGKTRRQLLVSGLFIGFNWGVFVYAININQLVQASLGYYINPLISIFLGIFFLKERLTISQYISIGFAFIGVLYLTLSYGVFPWISLIIAFSFAMYGLLKKVYQLDSLNSLLAEALFVLPVTSILMFRGSGVDVWMDQISGYELVFVFLAGIVTTIPLILFAEGAKQIPLSSVGFLQYIAPTLMLFVGVVLYNEAFTIHHVIAFGLIWFGLVVYTYSIFKKDKKSVIITG